MKSIQEKIFEAQCKIDGVNWLIHTGNWPSGRFTFLREYAQQYLKDNTNLKPEQKELIEDYINGLKSGNNTMNTINGESPYFENFKFTYDLCKWAIENTEVTKPRAQKINKIIKELEESSRGKLDSMEWGTKNYVKTKKAANDKKEENEKRVKADNDSKAAAKIREKLWDSLLNAVVEINGEYYEPTLTTENINHKAVISFKKIKK